jgi:hypothetical protein
VVVVVVVVGAVGTGMVGGSVGIVVGGAVPVVTGALPVPPPGALLDAAGVGSVVTVGAIGCPVPVVPVGAVVGADVVLPEPVVTGSEVSGVPVTGAEVAGTIAAADLLFLTRRVCCSEDSWRSSAASSRWSRVASALEVEDPVFPTAVEAPAAVMAPAPKPAATTAVTIHLLPDAVPAMSHLAPPRCALGSAPAA